MNPSSELVFWRGREKRPVDIGHFKNNPASYEHRDKGLAPGGGAAVVTRVALF